MKYCTNCGNELPEKASFCSNCGTKFNNGTTTARMQDIDTEIVKERLNKTFNQTKKTIQNSGYVNYFKRTAKQPTVVFDETLSNNGFIHFGLLALITASAIYSILAGTISVAMNQTGLGLLLGSSSGYLSELRQLIPNLLSMSITIYGVFVFSAYMIIKYLMKKELTLNQVLTEFGGLLTPNIILLGTAAALALLIKIDYVMLFGTALVSSTFLLCFIALNYYIYAKSDKHKKNTFYVLLISNILVLLLFSLIVYIQIEPLITAIDRLGSLGW